MCRAYGPQQPAVRIQGRLGKISGQLKTIYTASTVAAAEQRFTDFAQAWKGKYPAMIGMWERSWPEFTPFLQFPVEIRKLIYTTNGIVIWSGPLVSVTSSTVV